MNATIEKISSNKVKINIVIDSASFEKGMQQAYRKGASKFKIPGFRPGKAPRKVIEMQYGESVFYEAAFDAIFPEIYDSVIAENNLKPVDRPSIDIEEIGSGKDMVITAEVFVKPEVVLGEYKGIEIQKIEHTVTDAEIDAEIKKAQDRVSRLVDITDRAVMMGDQINLDYAGYCDGNAFEGGTATAQTLEIGSGTFIPGFEEQLIGVEVGKEVTVYVTFPTEYHSEELAGKAASFVVTVNAIKAKEVPTLDDDFAKDVSEFDTFEAYKADIISNLESAAAKKCEDETENAIIAEVVKIAQCDIPEPMIESQVHSILRDMEMRMSYQGLKMEDFLKYTGQTHEQMHAQYRPEAEKRVRTQLVLEAIRDAEGIKADDDAVEAEIAKYAEQAKKSVEEFKKNLSPTDWEYIGDMVTMQKTVDMLKSNSILV